MAEQESTDKLDVDIAKRRGPVQRANLCEGSFGSAAREVGRYAANSATWGISDGEPPWSGGRLPSKLFTSDIRCSSGAVRPNCPSVQ